MRFRIAALLAILVGVAAAPTATATKPLKVPLVFGPATLEGVCDFPVGLDVIGPQNQKQFVFSDGRVTINGQLTTRVTNLDEPSKVWEGTTSGPVYLTPNPDGTTSAKGTGVNLWYFFPGMLGEGAPGALFLVKGHSEEVLDADGIPITGSFSHRGSIENLCDTLG